jgi:fructoselysine and glucoselysine-specific PTS system IIA component
MKKLVLATHGYFAKGLKNALEIVTSDVSNIIDINAFTSECPNPEVEIKKLLEQYSDEDLLVLTDVYFGGVNQIFLRAHRSRKFKLVTGINLPLAVELASCIGEELSDEKIAQIVELCRNEMREVKPALEEPEQQSEDGDETL